MHFSLQEDLCRLFEQARQNCGNLLRDLRLISPEEEPLTKVACTVYIFNAQLEMTTTYYNSFPVSEQYTNDFQFPGASQHLELQLHGCIWTPKCTGTHGRSCKEMAAERRFGGGPVFAI